MNKDYYGSNLVRYMYKIYDEDGNLIDTSNIVTRYPSEVFSHGEYLVADLRDATRFTVEVVPETSREQQLHELHCARRLRDEGTRLRPWNELSESAHESWKQIIKDVENGNV